MASQQPFILSPSYSGPMIIAESLRKMKTNNGLNRMLSSYNKRFFVLDLNHCNFYYLPERGAHFSDATDIPLANVISVRVTKQSQGLEEDKVWKHEFVLTTKKKNLELISDSKTIMDKFLYALANIINTKTNKPLFNWSHYTGAQDQTLSPSNLLSFKSPDASPQKQNEASFSSPERSPVEDPTVQPEQRGELTPELFKIQQACKDAEQNQQSPASSGSEKENKESQDGVPKKYATLQHRRKGNSFAALRGKGFEVDKEERRMEKLASPVKEEVSPAKSRKDEMESLSPAKKGDKIQIKVEMLNFDQIEKEITKVGYNNVINSERESKKCNPGEQSVRRGANRLVMNNKSASVRNMVGQDGDFTGCNQADLSHQRMRVNKNSEGNSFQALGSARRGESEKQMSFGTGLGQEVGKFSLVKNEKMEKVSVDVSVKKSANDDDDWDNEMFGDGKHQLSPLKPKNYEQKQSKTMCSDKKSQLSQKRIEFVANRQGTYNDWDDEL